jgi:hypothetical protein
VPKFHIFQNSFLSGVLDPRAAGRVDSTAYQEGLKVGNNIVIHHLGGAKRRPGLRRIATLPNALLRYNASVITVVNGDSDTVEDNADDSDTATSITAFNIGTSDPFVVVHYDLGSAQAVRFADVLGIELSTGTSIEFRIQYSTDNAAWTNFGTALELVDATIARDYRRGNSDNTSITARYWRVVRDGSTDLGGADVTLTGFEIWLQEATISNVRLIPFEISTEDKYVLALTDRCGTVYKDEDTFVTYIPLPYLSVDILDIDGANLAETLALVHEDYEPRFIIREWNSENFQPELVPFDTVPQYDFDDSASPTPTSEIQVVTFASGWAQGNTFQVELEQARSGVVTYAGDSTAAEQNTTAANLQKAIQGLFSVTGFTGVTVARTGTREYTVTFAEASADTYDLLVINPLSASVGATTTRTQAGVTRTEDAWSETRGWPRTVTFFEGRMYFGGTRSLQQSLFGSAINNILDFLPVEGLDDEPIFVTLASAKLNAINGLYAGRSLQLFTSGGEFRFIKETGTPIVPTDAPVPQTEYGSARIPPVSIDGSTIFVHRTRKALRDFRFDFEQGANSSLGISALSSHLLTGVVGTAAWNGSQFDELGLVFAVNSDGTLAIFNTRAEIKAQAWMSWSTDGTFEAVGIVEENRFFAVRRTINAVDYLFLEIADEDCYTDCAVLQTQSPSVTVTGLGHLNGEECRVRADSFVLENQTPSGGSITMEQAGTTVEVGLNFDPTVTLMPLTAQTPNKPSTLLEKQRIVRVAAKVRNTLGLLMNGRPMTDRFFDLDNFDTPAETYSGHIVLSETTNWDVRAEKTVTFSQEDPLPMEILMVQTTVASEV